jgi:thioredoxin 1
MAARISKADFAEKVLNSATPVLVDFYSDSCVACKKLAPVLGDAEDNYEGWLTIYKVNTNFDADLAEEREVTANPTLILFKDGEELDRKVGALRPVELTSWIEEFLG